MEIKNREDFKKALESGPYAWPGGYPTYFIMGDGEPVCFDCVKNNSGPGEVIDTIFDSIEEYGSPHDLQWNPVAYDINYEDDSMVCAHCNGQIESAYGEEEDQEEKPLGKSDLPRDFNVDDFLGGL